jgi:DNA-binding transcriptional MerR regulator
MATASRKPPQPQPLLVRADVVAQALSVSPRQVSFWQEQGRIPFHKLGRRCVRFSLPDVLEALGISKEGAP